jgi:hypothetical protein
MFVPENCSTGPIPVQRTPMNLTEEQLEKLARLCVDLDEAQNSGDNEKYAMLQSLWLNTTDRLYAADPENEAYIQHALPKLIPVIQGDLERQARIAQRAERMTQKRQEEFRTLQQEIVEIELHLSKMQDALDRRGLAFPPSEKARRSAVCSERSTTSLRTGPRTTIRI